MKQSHRISVAIALGVTMLSLATIAVSLATLALQTVRPRGSVSVRWEADQSISIRASSDGPFLVTHLIYASGSGLGVRAALDPPLALTESGSRSLAAPAVKKLVWVEELTGTVVTRPNVGDPLLALYTEARVSP